MANKTCTPFCDPKKSCPGHHELLTAVLNCSDRRDPHANSTFEHLQSTVKAHLKKGWKLNDNIRDPVKNYRFPLLHWACVLGKCRVIEWMVNFGFSVDVRTSATQETALHRCVLCLHYTNVRRPIEKLKRTVHLLKDCLFLKDEALQTPLHVAAAKLITGNKSNYYAECLEAMVAKAKEIPGKTAEILNAKDHLGNTVLHYLAQNEIGFVALRSIVNAGGDTTIVNNKKLTPLDVAMNSGSTRMIKILNSTGTKSQANSRYDDEVYTADSPPESPVNLEENEQDGSMIQNEDPSPDATNEESLCDHSYSAGVDAPALECSEDSSFSTNGSEDVPTDVTREAPSSASNEVSLPITGAFCGTTNDTPSSRSSDAASAPTDNVPPPHISSETLPGASIEPPCDNQDDVTAEASDDGQSDDTDEAGALCHEDGTHSQADCICASIGVQTPVINPYSCIVHIKQEQLSPFERCQQESMSEISSSSELQSVTPLDLPNSVITLLQGAGLLQNLTQIAEQTRSEDEHVLTDKLEMVKETNNQLETSDKEINEKNTRIASLEAELTELKQQVEAKEDEKERLLLKRKLLNEECNTLQKKLHCCDSLLKVVPRGGSDV